MSEIAKKVKGKTQHNLVLDGELVYHIFTVITVAPSSQSFPSFCKSFEWSIDLCALTKRYNSYEFFIQYQFDVQPFFFMILQKDLYCSQTLLISRC